MLFAPRIRLDGDNILADRPEDVMRESFCHVEPVASSSLSSNPPDCDNMLEKVVM